MTCWYGCLSGVGCNWLAYGPANGTSTASSVLQQTPEWFILLVLAHLGSPGHKNGYSSSSSYFHIVSKHYIIKLSSVQIRLCKWNMFLWLCSWRIFYWTRKDTLKLPTLACVKKRCFMEPVRRRSVALRSILLQRYIVVKFYSIYICQILSDSFLILYFFAKTVNYNVFIGFRPLHCSPDQLENLINCSVSTVLSFLKIWGSPSTTLLSNPEWMLLMIVWPPCFLEINIVIKVNDTCHSGV